MVSGKHSLLFQSGVIYILAFCVRIVFFIYRGSYTGGDAPDYIKYANNLYSFGVFSGGDAPNLAPSIRRPPLYPHFLAFFQWLQGGVLSLQTVVVAQIALDSFVAVAILFLARKAVSKPVALFLAIVYVFHPDEIFRPTAIQTENPATFLLAVAVVVFVYAVEKENAALIGLGGALLGLAVLCRPVLVFVPVIITLIFLFKFKTARRYVYAGVLAGVFLLTLAPWVIRNYQITGEFVFIQSSGTVTLFVGALPDEPRSTDSLYAEKLKGAKTDQEVFEADKVGREQTLNIILRSPKDYLLLRLKKYPHLFLNSFDEFTGLNIPFGDAFREGKFFILAVKMALLIALSLLPFLLGWVGLFNSKNNMTRRLCAALWFSNLLIYLPLWIEHRFWTPVIPFQLISAGVGFTVLKVWFLKRRENRKVF